MRNKKRAFTLTELLVVVIVIGVLAAVVLPKFNKVIETRKTTEAEEIMAAVRTEQEQRCSASKRYTMDFSKLADVLPSQETQNYEYTLTGSGVTASSKGSYTYDLKMPSFADGRFCCDGDECSKLNKDYPSCTELIARADYTVDSSCAAPIQCTGATTRACGCNNSGTQTRTCNTSTGTWSDWSTCSVANECTCSGASSQSCTCGSNGTGGTQTRTCNTSNGTWSDWSTCSGCTYSCSGASSRSCTCSNGGSGTQTRTCDTSTGQWGAWGTCGSCSSSSGNGSGNGNSNTACGGYTAGSICYKRVSGCCLRYSTGGNSDINQQIFGQAGGKVFSFYYAAVGGSTPGGGGLTPGGGTCEDYSGTHKKYACNNGSWSALADPGGCVRQVAGNPTPLCPAGV